jgi:hypothetical protein
MGLYYDVFLVKGHLVKRELRGCIQMDSTTWLREKDLGTRIYLGDICMLDDKHRRHFNEHGVTYDGLFSAFHNAAHFKKQLGDYRGEAVIYCHHVNTIDMITSVIWCVPVKN